MTPIDHNSDGTGSEYKPDSRALTGPISQVQTRSRGGRTASRGYSNSHVALNSGSRSRPINISTASSSTGSHITVEIPSSTLDTTAQASRITEPIAPTYPFPPNHHRGITATRDPQTTAIPPYLRRCSGPQGGTFALHPDWETRSLSSRSFWIPTVDANTTDPSTSGLLRPQSPTTSSRLSPSPTNSSYPRLMEELRENENKRQSLAWAQAANMQQAWDNLEIERSDVLKRLAENNDGE